MEKEPTEIVNPHEIRAYLGSEANLSADKPLDEGGYAEKEPIIQLDLRDKDNACSIHLSAEHFAFLERRLLAVRRALDGFSSTST